MKYWLSMYSTWQTSDKTMTLQICIAWQRSIRHPDNDHDFNKDKSRQCRSNIIRWRVIKSIMHWIGWLMWYCYCIDVQQKRDRLAYIPSNSACCRGWLSDDKHEQLQQRTNGRENLTQPFVECVAWRSFPRRNPTAELINDARVRARAAGGG